MKRAKEYRDLAREVMEPVLTVAGRRLEQALEEVHASSIKPLTDAITAALHFLDMAYPEQAREVLREALVSALGAPKANKAEAKP